MLKNIAEYLLHVCFKRREGFGELLCVEITSGKKVK